MSIFPGLGVLFHVLTYFIPSNLINQTDDGYLSIPMESKMLMGLLPNINLVWGVKVLIELEGKFYSDYIKPTVITRKL